MAVAFKVDAHVYRALQEYAEARSISFSRAGRLLLTAGLVDSGGSLGALDLETNERDEIRREVVADTRRIIAKALNAEWKK